MGKAGKHLTGDEKNLYHLATQKLRKQMTGINKKQGTNI